jgi:serine/threonine-protein kinase HipA
MPRYEVSNRLFLWYLGEPQHPVLVGDLELVLGVRGVSLRYVDTWLADPDAFALSEDLPLTNETFVPEERDSTVGALEDARPDRWGERVIQHIVRPPRLSVLEYLYFAGDTRYGALGVSTSREEYRPAPKTPMHTFDDVAQIQEVIRQILLKEPVPEDLRHLVASGGSMGGAQPKSVLEHAGEQWIVKFSPGDNIDTPLVEHATMTLASRADIRVSETMPIQLPDGHALAVKRFDRIGEHRVHALSARTVLHAQRADYGYPELAQFIRTNGPPGDANPAQRQELFRRMVFNILVGNTDDHEKNHALLRRRDRKYTLAPAYDVLPTRLDATEQQFRVSTTYDSTIANALSMAEAFELKPGEAEVQVGKVVDVVAGWKQHFAECGITKSDIEALEEHIDSPHLESQRAQYLGRRAAREAAPTRPLARTGPPKKNREARDSGQEPSEEERWRALAAKVVAEIARREQREARALGSELPQAQDDTRARAELEEELYRAAKKRPKDLAEPMELPRLEPEACLAAFKVRLGKAATAWFEWRDQAPASHVLAARLGRGPGAELCHRFREARSWVLETARQIEKSEQLERGAVLGRRR